VLDEVSAAILGGVAAENGQAHLPQGDSAFATTNKPAPLRSMCSAWFGNFLPFNLL